MSFATIAAPEAVRCPASAQLLLPIARSANVVVRVVAMARGTRADRPVPPSAAGTAAAIWPSIGASHSGATE
jgi:hypothetical protein